MYPNEVYRSYLTPLRFLQRSAYVFRNKPANEFGGDVTCSCRMIAGNFDKLIYISFTVTCRNDFTKDTFLSIIVQSRIEVDSPLSPTRTQPPAGQTARSFVNIRLRVATIYSECVQFQ